jgi:riboflavin synthase
MFTGIIEATAKIVDIQQEGSNVHFFVQSSIGHELKIDQSVAHNGVCLTVVEINHDIHKVTAIDETLQKTNLGDLGVGALVNLERCMPANGRFDGHIVQGHVDTTGICRGIEDQHGSWLIHFEHADEPGFLTVEKGSITINGISLTCFNSSPGKFSVAIIPYTWEHTNFNELKVGDRVNLEFDIVGKYVQRLLTMRS